MAVRATAPGESGDAAGWHGSQPITLLVEIREAAFHPSRVVE